tara:strand:+ start:229 stop:540 length:312 start_codon:yes stop_codon:yes gene_type:complete
MFIFKTIPKHSFLDDSPFWYDSQREWGYVDELTGQINIPYDTPYDTPTYQGVTVTNGQGGVIFEANENQITWNGSDLMTEERVREIFRGEIEEVLRRSGIEVT